MRSRKLSLILHSKRQIRRGSHIFVMMEKWESRINGWLFSCCNSARHIRETGIVQQVYINGSARARRKLFTAGLRHAEAVSRMEAGTFFDSFTARFSCCYVYTRGADKASVTGKCRSKEVKCRRKHGTEKAPYTGRKEKNGREKGRVFTSFRTILLEHVTYMAKEHQNSRIRKGFHSPSFIMECREKHTEK